MELKIQFDAVLAPIPGDNPAGENLRYTAVYDEIYEAMREEEQDLRESWMADTKQADWDKVIMLSVNALTYKTKDLTIGVWLTQALVKIKGFTGLTTGLRILTGLLTEFWEHLYPEIEDDDIDFRAGPIENLSDKVSLNIMEIPLTDATVTPGYSLLQWQESRMVGYENENKENRDRREEQINEGKITAEDFDSAVWKSSFAFYKSYMVILDECLQEFQAFEEVLDEKFGVETPSLYELRGAIRDCHEVVEKIFRERNVDEQYQEPEAIKNGQETNEYEMESESPAAIRPTSMEPAEAFQKQLLNNAKEIEKSIWDDAVEKLGTKGIGDALEHIFSVSCSAPSERERYRYRLQEHNGY